MSKSNRLALSLFAAAALTSALAAVPARAQGALVLYCGVQEEWCRAMSTAFEKETGIKVAMTRKSSGEIYAQVKAESANPKGDVWWGGTGDPHQQAAEEGLTEEYKSANNAQLQVSPMLRAIQTSARIQMLSVLPIPTASQALRV